MSEEGRFVPIKTERLVELLRDKAELARYSDTTPIDAAWLESMGWWQCTKTMWYPSQVRDEIAVEFGENRESRAEVYLYGDRDMALPMDNPTRGQLLHLLAALTTEGNSEPPIISNLESEPIDTAIREKVREVLRARGFDGYE